MEWGEALKTEAERVALEFDKLNDQWVEIHHRSLQIRAELFRLNNLLEFLGEKPINIEEVK